MPFERYLRADDSYYYQDHGAAYTHGSPSCLPDDSHLDHHHSHAVQFQIPQFMLNGPPVLAPGGGAEVLPVGLLDSGPDSFASSWFANNGFAPLHSALTSRHIPSGSASTDSASTAPYPTFPPNDTQRLLPGFAASVDPQQRPLLNLHPSFDLSTTYISYPPSAISSSVTSCPPSSAVGPDLASSPSSTVSSTLGLSVYSASGFDILSILCRVANRPNQTVQLGPVDFSCSFVIVDVRRYDSPIVYASPTFCHLTGYNEQEVLGRNCRFLQSPTGSVARGEPRRFVAPEAVSHMRKLLSSSKECQTTLINYRKGGQPFINLVTVIPLRGGAHNTPGEADEVAYHIGFQVDLTDQPNRILDKLRNGSYHNGPWGTSTIVNDAAFSIGHGFGQLSHAQNMTNIGTKGGRHGQMMSIAVSKELRNLIADTSFTDSVPISTGTNMSGPTNASSGSTEQASNATVPLTMLVTPPGPSSMNRMSASSHTMAGSFPVSLSPSLSLLLLEFLPDFLLVLSLKGAFLYVAPSVRLVLGYEPDELVGRSISDICHPADLVPLMRELKEGSVNGLNTVGTGDAGLSTSSSLVPKSVDLLFRALSKASPFRPSPRTGEMFPEQGDFQPSQSSPASTSQSSLSSETPSSNGSPDGSPPPYVWLECRGRLHVEPGKGRKAIILSGRARWMPVVRWKSVDMVGSLDKSSYITPDPRPGETSLVETSGEASIEPPEFWALLSSQGTFLVASASVRDVLGWGTSEMIGRSIWAMMNNSRSSIRERVEAELAKLDIPEPRNVADPSPTVVTTSLVHREFYVVPVRLAFYRTPRPREHASPSSSSIGAPQNPLTHPLNNPLCPIVCQATVLSSTEHPSRNSIDAGFDPGHIDGPSHGNANNEPSMRSSSASIFEELETSRGSSWQYELQQLKFANQRLHEELNVLEASSGAGCVSSSSTTSARSVPFGQPSSISISQLGQTPSHYTLPMHPALSSSLPSMRLPNSLHEHDPPSSEWSSLAGANGQGTNPLKRSWRSEDGPTT